MRCLVILCCVFLSGCLSLNELVTVGASTAGAAVSTAVGLPTAGVAVVTTASGLTAASQVDEPAASPEDFGGQDGQINTFYELASFAIANFFSHILTIGILAGAVWFLTGYIGMRIRRPEEKMLEKQVMGMFTGGSNAGTNTTSRTTRHGWPNS